MVTTIIPSDWKDLQAKVAKILRECGFDVQLEVSLKTARGVVEADVYAVEVINGRKYTIVCECKKWKSDIPQAIIHAFRTVVQDLGCNIGYVITTADFQKGALQNADFANIELLTWPEFQDKFFRTWVGVYFVPTITRELDMFMEYNEPLSPRWYELLLPDDRRQFDYLRERYEMLAALVMINFSTYSRTINSNKDIPALPLSEMLSSWDQSNSNIPLDILHEKGYSEFLDKVISYGKAAVNQFRELRDKYGKFSEDD